MNIVLYQPQIPQNAGNIARTCAVTGSKLFLVKPLGFSLAKRHLKRAGLDYWDQLDIVIVDSFEDINMKDHNFYFFSSKASKAYTDIHFCKDDFLIFGSETSGLPPTFFDLWPQQFVTIPMKEGSRCLNLSNSVAIAIYESLRQNNWPFS